MTSCAESAVAWVESPFQLLSVIEGAAAGNLPARLIVFARGSVGSYRSLVDLLDIHRVDGLSVVPAPPWRAVRGLVGATDTFVVGDLFSGAVQSLVVSTRPTSVTLVDDGSSTLAALEHLGRSSSTLRRPRSTPTTGRALLGRAAHALLRRRSASGRLSLSSGLPVDAVSPVEIPVLRHAFSWARDVEFGWLPPRTPVIVLGSALAADGLISEAAYHRWLRDQLGAGADLAGADLGGAPVFFAHRRESPSGARLVRSLGGSVATTAGLPIELIAHRTSPSTRFVTLPSTTVLTLRSISPSTRVECTPVPADWWMPGVPASMRALAETIAASGVRACTHPDLASGERAHHTASHELRFHR